MRIMSSRTGDPQILQQQICSRCRNNQIPASRLPSSLPPEPNSRLIVIFFTEFSFTVFQFANENIQHIFPLGVLLKPDFLSRHLQIILKKNNLKHIRYHDLRYSCASLLIANGVSLKEIQDWLGHSDYGTTANIYSHLEYSAKVNSANKIAEKLKLK